jgi:hypothetical protein
MTRTITPPLRFAILRRTALAAAILLAAGAQGPAPRSMTPPDTPAGRMLRLWLTAFNSQDDATVQGFYEQHMPAPLAASAAAFARQTGGIDLIAIKPVDALRILFIAKDRATPNQGVGVLTLADAASPRAQTLSLRAVPPGTVLTSLDVDGPARARVIDATIAAFNENYVDPAIAKKIEAELRAQAARGAFDRLDGPGFARALNDALLSVSHDKHIGVDFLPATLPPPAPPSPQEEARLREQIKATHCGFAPARRLPGNVGLLAFNSFPAPELCADEASAAMNSLGDADAIIFDLRGNGGGSPAMVAYLSSYLFAGRTHVTDIWTRKTGATEEFWTRDVPGTRYAKQPVFLLTAARTFSGAEDFSYSLQALKRAVIVGETTGGGAHPVSGRQVGEGFTIRVPYAKTVNPVTHTNWEGVGVEPDVKVRAAQALETAQALAAKALAPK